jgi:drug/metabolite transporter (DMT)-like permease
MDYHYISGVALGILGGFLTQGGQLLEKKAVNEARMDHPEKGFMRSLFKSPVWVVGFFVGLGCGTAAYMLAQSMIGPALVPGLMASGLIVLAVGSVKMNKEVLNRSEIFGVFLMMTGILLLGLSGLGINSTQVRATLADRNALLRIAIFTVCVFTFFIISRVLVIVKKNRRGMFIGLGNGFLSSLSDFWINPLLALVVLVLGGRGNATQIIIVGFAASLLVFCGTFITWQNQVAFKYAQASNIIPVAQVPNQIAPVLVYFYIFALSPAKSIAIFYILTGTFLTIIAGFLLGRRQEVPISK